MKASADICPSRSNRLKRIRESCPIETSKKRKDEDEDHNSFDTQPKGEQPISLDY